MNERIPLNELAKKAGIKTISANSGEFVKILFKDATKEQLLDFISKQHERIVQLVSDRR